MADDESLLAALTVLQQHGHIGQPLVDAVAHSDRFVRALPLGARTLIDLGSGGGLPGLVIAARRPALHVTLVERRQARADDLQRAVRRLGMGDHVTVVAGDVDQLSGPFDVVTARAFAGPTVTLAAAMSLLADDGLALISDPPGDTVLHWQAALAAVAGAGGATIEDLGSIEGVHRFRRCST